MDDIIFILQRGFGGKMVVSPVEETSEPPKEASARNRGFLGSAARKGARRKITMVDSF